MAFAQDWCESSAEHFIIYYTCEDSFANDAAERAEKYYNRIADDLGYSRTDSFWLWERRVKIYLYPDKPSYLKATNQPEWSEGVADYKLRQISSFVQSRQFLESVLPHEIGHLIFRDFIGLRGDIPIWLEEGIAQRQEEVKRDQMQAMAKKHYNEDTFLSVADMMRLDINYVTHMDRVYIRINRLKNHKEGVLFVTGNNLVATYYLEAYSIINFLIEMYGSDSFAHFCRELRDGKTMEEALGFAYPSYIRSIKDLEDRWREYMDKQ